MKSDRDNAASSNSRREGMSKGVEKGVNGSKKITSSRSGNLQQLTFTLMWLSYSRVIDRLECKKARWRSVRNTLKRQFVDFCIEQSDVFVGESRTKILGTSNSSEHARSGKEQ